MVESLQKLDTREKKLDKNKFMFYKNKVMKKFTKYMVLQMMKLRLLWGV